MQTQSAITETNHGAYIVVTAALALVCMLLFLGIRLVVRRPWVRLFGLDDCSTVVASAFAFCQSVVILASSGAGLGQVEKELPARERDKALKLLYAGDLLYVPAIFLGQLAVTLFFLRLTGPNRSFFHRMARFIAGATLVCGAASFLIVAIRVENGLPAWTVVVVNHKSMLYRWFVTEALSILIEIGLMICPAWLLWTLQMPLDKKLSCAVYFGLRFPTIILSVVRLIALAEANRGSDRTFDYTMPAVWTQVEMHFIVLAATIPIIRNPLTKLNSGFLNTTLQQMDPEASAAYASSKSGGSGKGQSSTMSRTISAGTSNMTGGGHNRRMLDQGTGQGIETTAEGGSESIEERQSILSEGSDKIIIKRTVMIDYT